MSVPPGGPPSKELSSRPRSTVLCASLIADTRMRCTVGCKREPSCLDQGGRDSGGGSGKLQEERLKITRRWQSAPVTAFSLCVFVFNRTFIMLCRSVATETARNSPSYRNYLSTRPRSLRPSILRHLSFFPSFPKLRPSFDPTQVVLIYSLLPRLALPSAFMITHQLAIEHLSRAGLTPVCLHDITHQLAIEKPLALYLRAQAHLVESVVAPPLCL